MANIDNDKDDSSGFTIIDDDPAPEYSPAGDDRPIPPNNAQVNVPSIPNVLGLNESIELGNDVLTALDAVVTKLYDANRSTTLPVPILVPTKDGSTGSAYIRGYATQDPAPPEAPPRVFKKRVQRMTTSEAAGYSCCLDLVRVLTLISRILEELGDVLGRGDNAASDTVTRLVDVLVAGYHQWARTRAQLQVDKNTSYRRILSMFNVYISQCNTQRWLTIEGLPSQCRKVFERDDIYSALTRCARVVRSHASLGVTEAWVKVMASVLPLVVRSCAGPGRYRKHGAINQANTYAYYVEDLLEERIRKGEAGAEQERTMHGFGLSEKNRTRLEDTDPWAAFVLNAHIEEQVVQSDTRKRIGLNPFRR